MKKILIYMLLLAAVVLIPVKGTDIGKLIPVEVVQVVANGETVVITTDMGETGMGIDVTSAAENLKATTAGIVFLDTADYLLVNEAAKDEAAELKEYLKPSVSVCGVEGEIDMKEAAAFLNVHRPVCKLRDVSEVELQEVLVMEEGRMMLKRK